MSQDEVAGDEYIYDETTGEWRPASEVAAASAPGVVRVVDAVGSILADGDSVTLIKDLKVKGANQTLKQGTVIRSIRRRLIASTTQSKVLSCARNSSVSAGKPKGLSGGLNQFIRHARALARA